ncbi:ABC transporter ATP-binding protein [Desulfosporosinus sp.]|uniref:ABC transporter ATP-binding protein n=1 Tax=Desulfosporosinus sp. TaxID=157907 RepID=UPI000E9950CD|nr:ABC transporter ATP-binding protein [Desulfosporosinus sp.]MBC2724474.1 ABC transporter ATP-binding protein [Desulfosporosinus sp.]MBC2725735.1 ABC transporter ATP-binding protein [Desulfosporosinus sp.]HBV88590.1 sodium ABC transporter ATP-binding protein [Desulfosporosinus sp.]
MNKESLKLRKTESLKDVDYILSVDDLSKRYKNFSLNKVSFQLPRGYIMGFIGPNGSGKSTTIKLIMNLLNRDSGEIKVFGLDNLRDELLIKDRIAFVYDENHYYDELTIRDMAKFVSSFYKHWETPVFKKYLRDFDLDSKQRIKELSKGMKMKLSLAIALSHQAELLIMDEPTAGLDPLVRAELVDILSSLIQDERKSVFFSTHITSDLDKIADYVTFIHNGKIVVSAPKDDLLDQYGIVKGANTLLNEETKTLFVGIKPNQFGFQGLVRDHEKARRLFKEQAIIEKPSLEDIMLYTVKGEQL